jgi:hypothetical protein
LTNVTTTNPTPKKSKAHQTKFADAHRACRTPTEREQLALVIRDGWKEGELREYARLYFFKNGRDYPTAMSYWLAIADIASGAGYPRAWLKSFRKGGSKPLPPRREGLLKRGRGNGPKVTSEEYAWPDHTEEFRSMIEQRWRDYFQMGPDSPVHPNAWTASYRAYEREQEAAAEVLRKAREAVEWHLVPKSQKKSPKAPCHKPVPQHDISDWGRETLKPHFNYEFPGHSEAFREEVAALARKGKKADAHVSPLSWKIACHKHYVLVDGRAQ